MTTRPISATSTAPAAPRNGWAERYSPAEFLRGTAAIVATELVKLRRDPSEILTRSIQPALWLLVFGQVFGRLHAVPTGKLDYFSFLAPGILAQSVLFIAIFFGISVIWERDLGILQKLLASPSPRGALVLGKAVSAGMRALAQGVIVYLMAAAMSIRLNWSPLALGGVMLAVMLGAALFSTFSLMIACLVKSRERFMGIGQVMTMPLFFTSNAIYPISIMPTWLKIVAHINPLSYQVDLLRALMVVGGTSTFGIGMDMLILTGMLIALIVVTSKLYPTIVQ
ncbi:ABC transporter permease [Chlorobaculum sp. MV4-Y]|uniref:ABC transporter permease n=1 Tax=Chlorobaculum sp. MV4-Y TaxID=2976335 RepID=UPI0021AFAAC1|nr:ABC transporter permease [Chlorobaculum sp. MV4-Y]UWX57816.1 ABC transporter permease [Chlorobaculum sp. MV4-Y]